MKKKSEITGLIKLSLRLFFKNFRLLFPLLLIYFIFYFSSSYFSKLYVNIRFITYLSIIPYFLFNLIIGSITIYTVSKIIKKEKSNYKESTRFIFTKFWNLLTTYLIATVIIILGTILFIIPGIYFGILYTFVLYVVLFKDLKNKEALNYSEKLVKGRWGKVFHIYVLIYFVPFLASLFLVRYQSIIATITQSLIGTFFSNSFLKLLFLI